MKRSLDIILLSSIIALINIACKKKYDLPDAKDAPAVSGYVKIDSIYKCYNMYYNSSPKPTKWYKFNSDVNLECLVTADETSGNIYKTVYVEDNTGALQIKLINKGGLTVGDKIRINLNGAVLNDYGDVVQLDSIDIEKRVVKLSSGNAVVPTKVTFSQLFQFDVNGHLLLQSRLVVVDSVEFAAGDKSKLFADPVGKYSVDRMLINKSSSTSSAVAVRSSGYANFANYRIPCGKGTMTVIVSQYITDAQLIIRNYDEVKLSSGGCPALLADFEDPNLLIGGWINCKVSGTIDWVSGVYNGKNYAQISNYVSSTNQLCETWLISPPINLSGAANPYFSFESAYNYTGPTLEVYVSTNYTSGNPHVATWIMLSPNLSGGSFNWVNSGDMSLNLYKSSNTRIAFKYIGTNTDGSNWEIDNVAVFGD